LQEQRRKNAELIAKLATLSAREYEITRLIVEGKSSKEIANDLGISPRTVEAHRANLFAKLDVNSLLRLIKNYGGLLA
jgi:DNA-binding CsgD family transcriptional regulator